MTFTNSATAQQPALKVPALDEGIWVNFQDAGQIDRDKQELLILRDQVTELKNENAILTKTNELLQKEADLDKQLADIAEKKAEASSAAFEQMKQVSDKWQELAKTTNKPKVSWPQILGGVIAGIIAGIFIIK